MLLKRGMGEKERAWGGGKWKMGTKQRTGNEVTDRAKVSNNNNISVWLGTFMHSDTYRLSTGTFYKTRRLLQGISEQKLKPPNSSAPLYLYWKQRQTSICIKHESPARSPKIVFPAFRLSRLHLSNPERLLRKYLQWWDYFNYLHIILGH